MKEEKYEAKKGGKEWREKMKGAKSSLKDKACSSALKKMKK
jgi:hypothetical protein